MSTASLVYRQGASGVWHALQTLFMNPYYWFMNLWFRRVRLVTVADLFEDRFGTLRRSFTDRHGEALVVIVSAPPFLPLAGPPAGLTREFAVALTLVLDRSVVRPSTATEFPSPDPALILQRRAAGHADVKVVATGEQLFSAGTRRRRTDLVTWP